MGHRVEWKPPCDPQRPCRCFGGRTPEQVQARCERLREENERLALECDRLRRELRAKAAENARLAERVDGLLLEARRAAGTAVLDDDPPPAPPPKPATPVPRVRAKRGPRFGHRGTGRPKPQHIDRRVDTTPAACSRCGSAELEPCGSPYDRVQEDLVPAHLEVTQYHHQPMRCRRCGGCIDPLSPDEIPGSEVLGPRVRAMAVLLRYRVGMSYDHAALVFETLARLHLAPGTLVAIDRDATARAEPLYAELCRRLRAAAAVYSDDTGWPSDGLPCHLWSHSNPELVVNHIDPRRDHHVVERFLGNPFGGTLITDCGSPYSPIEALGGKQKCHSHLGAAAAKLRALAPDDPSALAFADGLTALVRHACALDAERKARGLSQWPPTEALTHKAELEAELDGLLAMARDHPDVRRLQARLARHRDEWCTFLLRPGVEPTNNPAERELRPSVILRKITYGNRSAEGLHCHSVLTSILGTARRHGADLLDFLVTLLTRPAQDALDAMLAPP